MKREKTQAIVLGAMMLAVFGVLIVIDTYTGAMFNVMLYYLMPLPFVVFGLKHGLNMMLCQGVGAIFISLFFGMPETIFFTMSAVMISVILVMGISKKWESSIIFLSCMVVTTLVQLLSLTILASLFGYDILAEVNEIKNWLGIKQEISAYILPLLVFLVGGLEAFIMTSLCDIVLLKLKMQRIPQFSILKMHLPQWFGIVSIICLILQIVLKTDVAIFFGMACMMILEVQGLSFLMLRNVLITRSKSLNIIYLLMCFIPGVHLLMASIGLFDIFSEKRHNLLYNRNNV